MAGIDLPVQAIREQIASAVDIVVHQSRFSDGRRRIVAIMEVTGMEAGRVQMQSLFTFRPQLGARGGTTGGRFTGCGVVPEFYEALRESGLELDLTPLREEGDHV